MFIPLLNSLLQISAIQAIYYQITNYSKTLWLKITIYFVHNFLGEEFRTHLGVLIHIGVTSKMASSLACLAPLYSLWSLSPRASHFLGHIHMALLGFFAAWQSQGSRLLFPELVSSETGSRNYSLLRLELRNWYIMTSATFYWSYKSRGLSRTKNRK